MFYPIGQEALIRLDGANGKIPNKEEVVHVSGNRERSLISVLTPSSLHIFNAQPTVPLCIHHRPESEVEEKGDFVRAFWQFDGSAIAVSTKRCHLLLFTVHLDVADRTYCMKESDGQEEAQHRLSRLRLTKDGLPTVALSLNVNVNLAAPVTSAVALREELFVCGQNGFSHHLQWNGKVDNGYSFQLSKIPFAHDQLQSKQAFLPSDSSVYVRDCAYAPLCGGFCLVLSDGRAALLTSNDPKFHPNSLLGVWAMQLKDAVCTDTNHRFRLLIFGCANGDVVAYHLDISGALVQTFRVGLRIKDGPEIANRLGSVREVRVLPQNGALAAVWDTSTGGANQRKQNGETPEKASSSSSSSSLLSLPPTVALFSPLGSQLWCSLEGYDDEHERSDCSTRLSPSYQSVEWGPEGYQLWLGGSNGLSRLDIARSAAFNNPYMEHSQRVVLIDAQRLYISPHRSREAEASAPHSVWSVVELRSDYIQANWPIRFAALDREEGKILVVAGTAGLSFCSLSNQRWKIFGNESQERDLHVTGGVFVWRGMVGVAAEGAIKLYPIDTRLDERFASTKETDARIIMVNIKGDQLVTMDVESRLLLYSLQRIDTPKDREVYAKGRIERTAEIRIGDIIPHVACVVSIHLTLLNYDDSSVAIFVPGVDTVLLNVSGRLITLSPKHSSSVREDETDEEENRFQLNQPLTIASFVEQVWHDRAILRDEEEEEEKGVKREHPLRNALWINCGARGCHVWLALLPGRRGTQMQHANTLHDSFISKRIMIPFHLEINPLLFFSGDCVAAGVESSPAVYGSGETRLTLYTLHRNTEVFIHHLLRQLLKRNLGLFALDLADSFRSLPYFTHSLELLLHNVLEEEATSAEPIPDPLLPRAVAFIQEFPEFLKTVAHCARKTELALWNALFEVTGSPNDLFEVCLRDGELETAASFLIILQNTETATVSLEQSAHLLRESLSSCSWSLARDLVRFARSIDADDMENPLARSPPPPGVLTGGRRLSKSHGNKATDELVLARFQAASKMGRIRHSHSVSEAGKENGKEASRKDSASSTKKVSKAASSDFSPSSPPSPSSPGASNPMLDRMHRLLHDHAARLLEEYCVRDLGSLCAHLEMDAPALLSSLQQTNIPLQQTNNTYGPSSVYSPLLITDFPLALQRVHSQFEWPYPVASSRVVDHLAKKFAGIRSSSSAVCLSDPVSSTVTPTSPLSSLSKREERRTSSTSGKDSREEENGSVETSTEVVAVMQRVNGEYINGETDTASLARSHSPSASSMRTSLVPIDEMTLMNGGVSLAVPLEPLIGAAPLLGPKEAGRGSQLCEAQLRHMIGVFGEISAMDWVFVLSLVLRDAAVARASLSVAAARRAGTRAVNRVLIACRDLLEWARANCLGYVQILSVFEAHLSIVCDAIGPSDNVHPPSSIQSQPVTLIPPSNGPTPIRPLQRPPPKNRALREAFVSPGGAVRGGGTRRRERSRSVDRSGHEEAVSNVTPESTECTIS